MYLSNCNVLGIHYIMTKGCILSGGPNLCNRESTIQILRADLSRSVYKRGEILKANSRSKWEGFPVVGNGEAHPAWRKEFIIVKEAS